MQVHTIQYIQVYIHVYTQGLVYTIQSREQSNLKWFSPLQCAANLLAQTRRKSKASRQIRTCSDKQRHFQLMTVTDSMYIQVYKYIPYKLCIYGIYNGVGLYIRYRHIPSQDTAYVGTKWVRHTARSHRFGPIRATQDYIASSYIVNTDIFIPFISLCKRLQHEVLAGGQFIIIIIILS